MFLPYYPCKCLNRICTDIFLSLMLFAGGCSSAEKKEPVKIISAADLVADTSLVPRDTVFGTDKALAFTETGLYTYKGKIFSGIISADNKDYTLHSFTSVLKGKKHGIYRSYYPTGEAFEVRHYKDNLACGRHYGYWENGKMKFDFLYYQDKKIGYFKKWFSNGKPYLFSNYKDDHEEGLQQGWRPNGKLFLNYVAKNGRAYGLQESALCYTLADQALKK